MVSSQEKNINSIKIEKIVNKGYGLGFHEGKPIFVYNAVPGDVVDLIIIHQTSKAIFAQIKQIVKPSEYRIHSNCTAFGFCGGCDWLMLDYKHQLESKKAIHNEIINNLRIIKNLQPIPSPMIYNYRNKSFMPVKQINGQIHFGMYARRSHSVVPHKKCLLHPDLFDEISTDIKGYIRSSKEAIYNEKSGKGNIRHIGFRISNDQKEIIVIIVTKKRKLAFTKQLVRILREKYPMITGIIQNINPDRTNRILGNADKILFGRDHIFTNIGSIKYKLNYQSFLQINYGIAEKLYSAIKDNLDEGSIVIDAYCGIGSIGLYVADKVKMILGIEENSSAVSDAVFNADLNRIPNCDFKQGKVEKIIVEAVKNINFDTIIFDPPRKGLDEKTIQTVIRSKIRKIIYVSCDPATQVRDVKKLVEAGYEIISSQLFDMFPNTYHMENLMVLELR